MHCFITYEFLCEMKEWVQQVSHRLEVNVTNKRQHAATETSPGLRGSSSWQLLANCRSPDPPPPAPPPPHAGALVHLWPPDSHWHVVTASGRYHSDCPPWAAGMVFTLQCWSGRGLLWSCVGMEGGSCDTISLINILYGPLGLRRWPGWSNKWSQSSWFVPSCCFTKDTNNNHHIYRSVCYLCLQTQSVSSFSFHLTLGKMILACIHLHKPKILMFHTRHCLHKDTLSLLWGSWREAKSPLSIAIYNSPHSCLLGHFSEAFLSCFSRRLLCSSEEQGLMITTFIMKIILSVIIFNFIFAIMCAAQKSFSHWRKRS